MNKKVTQSVCGFTLVELMVVVAIIGILATIALPSYNSYIEKTNLAQAKRDVIGIYQAIEVAKLANPNSVSSQDNYQKVVDNQIKLANKNNSKYIFAGSVNAENKLFTVNIVATPKKKSGNNYLLRSDTNGNVLRCKISQPDNCEAF